MVAPFANGFAKRSVAVRDSGLLGIDSFSVMVGSPAAETRVNVITGLRELSQIVGPIDESCSSRMVAFPSTFIIALAG